MNKINAVSKTWFKSKQTVYTEDYDSIWFYEKMEFGILISSDQICVDVLSPKRWKRDTTKRQQVGSFVFDKTAYGWRPEQSSIHRSIQGHGVGQIVYRTLANNGYPVCSGTSMSPGALKMWMRLCNESEVLTQIRGKWYQVTDVGSPLDLLEENRLVLWG